jgi:hypothetical protein
MHLNILIPVTTLLVKVFVRVFSREDYKELVRSVTNLPLELMLIAISFMLSALTGLSDNYVSRFSKQSDADLFASVSIIVMFVMCLGINLLTRFLRILAGKLFFAFKQYRQLVAQPRIPGAIPDIASSGRIFWAIVYCMLVAIVLVLSFGSAVATLTYVLHLIQ